jgi:hypothetical protein
MNVTSNIQANYSPHSAYRLYQNAKQPQPQMILAQSQQVQMGLPGPCTRVINASQPHAEWAMQFAGQPARLNVDGIPVIDNTCLTACSANAANMMVNPSPYANGRSYVLPGGVQTAVKVFTPCGMAPVCTADAERQRAQSMCGL